MSKIPGQALVSTILISVALVFLLLAQSLNHERNYLPAILEKSAFAILVSVAVRWLMYLFDLLPEKKDAFATDSTELRKAIQKAKQRIWIHQTWLPGVGGDAEMILRSSVKNTRLVLLSFAPESPIYPRIKTRHGLGASPVVTAQNNSAGSAHPFKAKGRKECVRFTRYRHPGWIAIIDDVVFWGATPMQDDNWAVTEVAYCAKEGNARAKHWINEFELLWEGTDPLSASPNAFLSHVFDEEKKYNPYL